MSRQLSLSELQSSSFYSGNDLLPTPDSTLPVDHRSRGRLVLPRLWRVSSRVIRACAWLVLLAQVGSVGWWLAILIPYYLLRFSLSRLRGGTPFSLALTLLVLLRQPLSGIAMRAWAYWQFWRSSIWRQRSAYCLLALLVPVFLYEWISLCLRAVQLHV